MVPKIIFVQLFEFLVELKRTDNYADSQLKALDFGSINWIFFHSTCASK